MLLSVVIFYMLLNFLIRPIDMNSIFDFLLIVFLCHAVRGELFSSVASLESLPDTERKVLRLLQDFRDREAANLDAVREYVHQLRSGLDLPHRKAANASVESATGDFIFIKRHSLDWNETKTLLMESPVADLQKEVQILQNTTKFPNNTDLQGAAESFQRLQAIYEITARDIADGQVLNTRQTPLFTAHEAFLVGQKQAEALLPGPAIEWLNVASEIYDTESEKTEDYVAILDWLQYSIFCFNGNLTKVLEISREIKELEPTFANVDANLERYTGLLANLTDEERAKFELPEQPYKSLLAASAHYPTLCRGELQPARRNLRHERCYFETHKHPFLLLQPAKIEVAHVDPDILLIHDVLRESQMEQIKKASKDHLIRATVISTGTAGTLTSARVSQMMFFSDATDPAIASASALAGYLANLNVKQAEELQVNNYGLAGAYLPHLDVLNGPEKYGAHLIDPLMGDRIATLMYYLSDVEAGGATVFPVINVTVFPEKGSAVFWHNLHTDGAPDIRTLHSGCPVLAGSKWVANKWFHEVQQDVTRPCGLLKDSPDPAPEAVVASSNRTSEAVVGFSNHTST